MSVRSLLIDDEPLVRELLVNYLKHEPDIEVVGQCANGAEAVRAVTDQRPDLMFLDVQLPDMSGFEVLSRLKVRQPEPRVLLVSATVAESDAAQALIAGATGYLAKPFRPAQLLDAVRSSLGPSAV